MGDSEQDQKTAVPEWQRPQPQEAAESNPHSTSDGLPVTLAQAKKFLRDEEVRRYPREKKIEFLKGKGLDEEAIQRLLQEEEQAVDAAPNTIEAEPQTLPTPAQPAAVEAEPETTTTPTPAQPAAVQPSPPIEPKDDRPPIVTYPEFLTKPARPPPLMTVDRFLATVYGFGGLAALVYGASKFVVAPMVDDLTSARISLHDTANANLARLVKKLEDTVSEIPPSPSSTVPKAIAAHSEDETASQYDDPTELFHRDIGVQTSLPPSPRPFDPRYNPASAPDSSSIETEPASTKQARRLRELASSVREVGRGFVSQSEDYDDIKAVLGVFKDELAELSYGANEFVGGTSLYGYGGARANEPDDEIRRAKENIRRVKGVLLSARSFPAGR